MMHPFRLSSRVLFASMLRDWGVTFCVVAMVCVVFTLGGASSLRAQLRPVETDIPVRDGKLLRADVYVNEGSRPKPVILVQTPYNKALYRLNFSLYRQTVFPLDSSRYQYVIVDWRGFHASKDAAVAGYDRGLDGYDVVEWIAAQPWCDGKVATYGGSALGVIQFQTARHRPPHLVCAVPMISDYRMQYSDYYYGGVLRREHTETLERLGFVSVDLITSQPVENAYWRLIASRSDYPEEIDIPLLMVSGWFDHYPDDVILAFEDLRARSGEAARAQHRLIMGPWTHSGVDLETQGELSFPDAVHVARDAALAFFDYHLNGAKNGWPLTPVMRYYQMGGNSWRDCERWTDVGGATRALYLADGGLLGDVPGQSDSPGIFTADPRDPSPSHGAARFDPFDPSAVAGPVDIREVVERRDDVLLYTTDVLSEDLTVAGSSRLRLYVRCDRADADFTVRLCDVFPDGRSIILTDAVQRARFREGTDREVFMRPGEVHAIEIRLQELAHTFRVGHRLRVVIGGSDYPRFDVNLNNGGAMYTAGDTLVARCEILHSTEWPSSLLLETPAATAAADIPPAPTGLRLHIPWPQPFAPGQQLNIRYDVPEGPVLHVEIRDLLGRHLRTLRRTAAIRGDTHAAATPVEGVVVWDGRDRHGVALSAGTYLITLTTGDAIVSRPVLLLR